MKRRTRVLIKSMKEKAAYILRVRGLAGMLAKPQS
jgi:hypothetical protein